jgi:hypothetical protein
MNTARFLVIAGALSVVSFPSAAASLNSMNEVGAALLACWTPPANTDNSSVTLSFSFKRDGTQGLCRRGDQGHAGLSAAQLIALARARHCRKRLHAAVQLAEEVSGRLTIVLTTQFRMAGNGEGAEPKARRDLSDSPPAL